MSLNPDFVIKPHPNGIQLSKPSPLDNSPSLSHVFEQAVSIYFMDTDNKLVDANDFQLHLLHLSSKEDMLGFNYTKLFTEQTELETLHQNNQRVLRKHAPMVFSEKSNIVSDDALQGMSLKSPWFDHYGKLQGTMGVTLNLKQNIVLGDNQAYTQILNYILCQNPSSMSRSLYDHLPYKFTPREIDIIRCVLKGKTLREAALQHHLSVRTVEYYFEKLKMKVGVQTRSEFIALFLDQE